MSSTLECFICGFKPQRSFRFLKNFKKNIEKAELIQVKDTPQTNFILNDVLEVPSRKLRRLPKTQKKGLRPNLARSTPRILNLCQACHGDVEGIKRIYEELDEVTRRFNEAKERIQEIMETKRRPVVINIARQTVKKETGDININGSVDYVSAASADPENKITTPAAKAVPKVLCKITCLKAPEESTGVIIKEEKESDAEDEDPENDGLNRNTFSSNKTGKTKTEPDSDDDDDNPFSMFGPDPDYEPGPSSIQPFKCSHCTLRFVSEGQLKWHRRNKHNLDRYKCNRCDKDFAARKSLNKHKKEDHEPEAFTCSVPGCSKQFRLASSLRNHVSMIHEKKLRYSCHVCGKGFWQRCILKRHLARTHKIGQKLYPCTKEGCSKVLSNLASFKAHVAKHEGKVAPYQCKHCPRKFFAKDCFHLHEIQVHNVEPSGVCRRNWPQCEICGKLFVGKDSLERHVPICRKDNVAKCQICGVVFDKLVDLRTHKKFKHPETMEEEVAPPPEKKVTSDKKLFQCAECGKTFTLETTLRKHVQIIHEKEPLHKCDVCGASKWDTLSLAKHQYLEHGIGEPRYQCESCGKAFWQLMLKKRHVCNGTQPETADLKVSVCEICGKEFNSKSNMKRHVRSHNKIEAS